MSLLWSLLIVLVVSGLAASALLLVRRRAPEGSVFEDGDRAAGVFGVLATGFSVLLGLIVFLAYSSYDASRAGAEDEARLVVQQYETSQFLPEEVRAELSGELVCYARSVVYREWPELDAGIRVEGFNPWGAEMFRTLQEVRPQGPAEETAYANWFDRTTEREEARGDRIHGAAGVIPSSLWIVLFFTSAAIFGFVLLFADSGERWYAQATLMGSVAAVITITLLLISALNSPFNEGYGGLDPVAMERSLRVLDSERDVTGDRSVPPCDARGVPTAPA